MPPLYQQFEQTLAWHCAPSMAGIKAADLVAWTPPQQGGRELLGHYVRLLAQRGICLWVLGPCRRRVLLLIFRPHQLSGWLEQPHVSAMLSGWDYPVERGMWAMLGHLRRRLQGEPFPHEIGLFLGYPPADVEGFLRDGGRGCTLNGAWKVYGDPEEAARRFSAFRRCRSALSARLAQGLTLAQIRPAA